MIINTTPHSIRFQRATDGEVFEVEPCGVILNAIPQKVPCGRHSSGAKLVSVVFKADKTNTKKLEELEQKNPEAVIVGSMIAAQAFPGRVLAMVPVPGFERVSPDQKRMRDDQFTSFSLTGVTIFRSCHCTGGNWQPQSGEVIAGCQCGDVAQYKIG